jgi:hypothetical protein
MTIERASNAVLGMPRDLAASLSATPHLVDDHLESTQETTVELLAADPLPTTQLAMDALWRAYRWPSCL